MSPTDAGRAGLAHALAHVCGLHFGGAPNGPGDPLRPHSKIAIMPSGKYYTHCPQGVPGDFVLPCDVEAGLAPAVSTGRAGPPGGAGPGCALCVRSPGLPEPRSVAARVFNGCALRLGESSIKPGMCFVPRAILDAGAPGFVRAVMGIVCGHEDAMCLGELCGMEEAFWVTGHAGRPSTGALVEFLAASDGERPPGARLDTVLLSHSSVERLAGKARSRGGSSGTGGWAVKAHHVVPDGVAYAIPSAGGPTLLRGPTVIHCERKGFCIRHYCATEAGYGGVQVALPWGGIAG